MRRTWIFLFALTWGCGDDGDGATADASVADAPRAADAPPAPDATPSDAGTAMIPEEPPQPVPTGPPNVKLITYNVALMGTIKWAADRKPLIVEALKAADADVMCLQEVWKEFSSPADLAALLSPAFPYAWWTWQGQTAWGNGLVIVSKHPLYRGRALRFVNNDPGNYVDRTIIGASVLMQDSYFHVLCTHLQAFDDPANLAARMAEIEEIKTWSMAEGYDDGPTFLLGDFNTGPAILATSMCQTTCNPSDVASYGKLLETWTDPNEDWEQCTYCQVHARPMQLLGVDPNEPDVRIDHCLYREIGASTQKERGVVFDEVVTFTSGGQQIMSTLSDHLGVRCVFAP